jgi:hypothetical protein
MRDKIREEFDKWWDTQSTGWHWMPVEAAWDAWQAALSQPAAVEGLVMVPVEPTNAMVKAMSESKARDDEGEFPAMFDLLDFSGENKTHTVLKAAYKAMLSATPAPPSAPVQQSVREAEAVKERNKLGYTVCQVIAAVESLVANVEEYEGDDGFLHQGAPIELWSALNDALDDMLPRAEEFETKYQALSTSPLLDKNDQAEGEKLEWEDYEKIRDFREVDFAINNFHLNCTADNATEMVKAIVENTRNYPQPPQQQEQSGEVRRSVTMTGKEIHDLALFAGFSIVEHDYKDELETEFVVEDCPASGVLYDDGVHEYYNLISYLAEYPEEGVGPLGDPIPFPVTPLAPESQAASQPAAQDDSELVEALRNNVRGFRNKESGEVQYVLFNASMDDWEEIMIIPNISNEAIDAALAQSPSVGQKGGSDE